MQTGFYHPDRFGGQPWFPISEPTPEILASYPDGYVSGVPVPPGEDYDYDPVLNDWVFSPKAKYTLESAMAMIVAYAEAFEAHVAGNVSIGEKLSWTVKEAAAEAHIAGNATADQIAMLQAEADQTGESLSDLSNAILSNATSFRQIAGSIAGLRRATRVALEAESDPVNYASILQTAQANANALAVSLGLSPMTWDV